MGKIWQNCLNKNEILKICFHIWPIHILQISDSKTPHVLETESNSKQMKSAEIDYLQQTFPCLYFIIYFIYF